MATVHRQSWSLLVLVIVVVIGGCARVAPLSDANGSKGGINFDYLFGDRRTVDRGNVSLVDDSEYAEYLDWKKWRDFQAYQEWKRFRDNELLEK